MPELPEVETIRRDLEPLVVGRRVEAVEVEAATLPLLAGVALEALQASLVGRTVAALGRHGKYLLFELDDGRTFVVHLGMTGRLLWRRSNVPEERFQRGRIVLKGGHDLRWCDVRKFGRWRLFEKRSDLLDRLGPEPISGDFTLGLLRAALAGRRAPVKAILLDQRKLAGLGNIYVDEALFEARIRPDTPAGDLSPQAVRRLHASTRSVLERGIENRGASFRDYVDAQGNEGRQQMYVQVFRRTGKPCYRCGALIQRTIVGGRSTHFCPRCQRRARKRPAPP